MCVGGGGGGGGGESGPLNVEAQEDISPERELQPPFQGQSSLLTRNPLVKSSGVVVAIFFLPVLRLLFPGRLPFIRLLF